MLISLHGLVILTNNWSERRDSNPQETVFETVVSTNCTTLRYRMMKRIPHPIWPILIYNPHQKLLCASIRRLSSWPSVRFLGGKMRFELTPSWATTMRSTIKLLTTSIFISAIVNCSTLNYQSYAPSSSLRRLFLPFFMRRLTRLFIVSEEGTRTPNFQFFRLMP